MGMAAADWGSVRGPEPAAGRLLVATPLLGDPHFARTVVYLLEHDGGGTVGVVLNRPSHTPVGQVLPDWHDAVSGPAVVFGGGPVQPDGALCLGELDSDTTGIRQVVDGVSTIDLDGDVAVIAAIARRLRVFAGHAGWSPGPAGRRARRRRLVGGAGQRGRPVQRGPAGHVVAGPAPPADAAAPALDLPAGPVTQLTVTRRASAKRADKAPPRIARHAPRRAGRGVVRSVLAVDLAVDEVLDGVAGLVVGVLHRRATS